MPEKYTCNMLIHLDTSISTLPISYNIQMLSITVLIQLTLKAYLIPCKLKASTYSYTIYNTYNQLYILEINEKLTLIILEAHDWSVSWDYTSDRGGGTHPV